MFQKKDIHAFIFDGSKEKNWVLVTQKMKSACLHEKKAII
jgi:hypothetical protein